MQRRTSFAIAGLNYLIRDSGAFERPSGRFSGARLPPPQESNENDNVSVNDNDNSNSNEDVMNDNDEVRVRLPANLICGDILMCKSQHIYMLVHFLDQ